MEHSLIIKRLQDTIDQLDKLDARNFEYSSFVRKSKENCGTVCCVAGWYPKWFPDSGLKWRPNYNETGIDLTILDGSYSYDNIGRALSAWHGLQEPVIDALFFGSQYKDLLSISIYSDLETVTKRFKEVLKTIQLNPNY